MENNKGSLFYYDYLYKNPSDGNGTGGGSQLVDDHSQWQSDKMSDAQRQLVQQQIDHITKQTVEQVQKNQGTIPGQFKDYVDKLFQKKA